VEIRAKAIVAFTMSGATARLISKERPPVPIVAYTPSDSTRRRMALYWGVLPRLTNTADNTDVLVAGLGRALHEEKLAEPGDRIVLLLGAPLGSRGGTNLLKVQIVE
jgi:pyruvate kinase